MEFRACIGCIFRVHVVLVVVMGLNFVGLVAAPAGEPGGTAPWSGFRRLDPGATGITFRHEIPANRHITNQMLLDGAGVALGDLDQDGRMDLVFAASGGGSQVWRNLGDWKFENVTAKVGAAESAMLAGDLTGVAIADLTGDGRPEIVFNSHASGIRILRNRGGMAFESLPFLQAPERGGHSVTLADVDGDGWVDVYVCNYRQRAQMDMPNARATF